MVISCRRSVGNAVDGLPFRFGDRLDGKSAAFFQQEHVPAVRFQQQRAACDGLPEDLRQSNIDHEPDGLVRGGSGVEVFVSILPCEVVGVSGFHDGGCPDDGEGIGIAVIEQHAVPHLCVIAQEVPCLVVTDTFPRCAFSARAVQVLNGEHIRFGFEEPIPSHAVCLSMVCSA